MDFLSEIVWGNSVEKWLAGVGVFLGTALLLRFLVPRLIRRARSLARSTSTHLDDSLVAAAGATKGFFYVAAGVWAGARYVRLSPGVERIFDQLLATALLLQLGLWLVAGYRSFLIDARDHRYPDDPEVATSFNLIRLLGTGTIWFLVFVFVLQAWGVNVTALITGLGIGGIAIALAVQNILSDLFASLSIIFDKPFLVGDYLQVDSFGGTVESIGLKSTQLRSSSASSLLGSISSPPVCSN